MALGRPYLDRINVILTHCRSIMLKHTLFLAHTKRSYLPIINSARLRSHFVTTFLTSEEGAILRRMRPRHAQLQELGRLRSSRLRSPGASRCWIQRCAGPRARECGCVAVWYEHSVASEHPHSTPHMAGAASPTTCSFDGVVYGIIWGIAGQKDALSGVSGGVLERGPYRASFACAWKGGRGGQCGSGSTIGRGMGGLGAVIRYS